MVLMEIVMESILLRRFYTVNCNDYQSQYQYTIHSRAGSHQMFFFSSNQRQPGFLAHPNIVTIMQALRYRSSINSCSYIKIAEHFFEDLKTEYIN